MVAQMTLLAVERNEELGSYERVNDLQLLLAGVAGHMERIGAVVDHIDALAKQLVDDLTDSFFVAGDRACGDDDAVAGADIDLTVGGERHAVKRAHLLALRAGGHDHLLVKGQTLDLVDVHHGVLGDTHIAQIGGDLHNILHAAPRHRDLASARGGCVNDLLNAVDIGGKGGDDDALLAAGEQPLEGLAHNGFAHRIARTLHIGGVGQQRQHALLAQFAEAAQIDHLAVDGRGVDLEVAGVDNDAHAGVDRKGYGVGDGVVDMDKFHIEFTGADHLARLNGDELDGLGKAVLLQLELDQPRGQACAVDGHIHLLEDIGDRADVVLVSVGDEETADTVCVLDKIGHIGYEQVNAVHTVVREAHAAVDNDQLAAVLINGHILADLIETAKRDNFHFFSQNLLPFLSV